jgi:GTP:adenosylcobinamide-phosphate guanylyltransferase
MAEEVEPAEQTSQPVLGKIDLTSFIGQYPPEVEKVLDASKWYVDEEMTLDFGEYVGRPSQNILMHTNMLAYFFAYGWKVSEVMLQNESGEWITTSVSTANQTSKTTNTSSASSSSSGDVKSTAQNFSDGTIARSETSQSGDSSSNGEANAEGSATQTVESGGAPYWYAYQKIKLTRRRMDGELVLKDMVTSFTNAYNEGRRVNNSRYDELVALYSLMLSHTEDEANSVPIIDLKSEDFVNLGEEIARSVEESLNISPADIRGLYDDALDNIRAALSSLKETANNLPSNWLASREADVNRQFDAKIAQAKAAMVANGTYSGTMWPNVESGYERDRQYALTDLADSVVTLKVDTYGKIATLTADTETRLVEAVGRLSGIETAMAETKMRVGEVRSRLMESAVRVVEAIQKNRIGITELRNTVLKWMFEFMERREDEYPGIEQLATVAERLGYGDGGAKPA